MEFRILGPLEVVVGETVVDLGRPRGRALLALLALESPRSVPVDRLVEELWRGAEDGSALASVRTHVSRLRSILRTFNAEGAIATRGGGYALAVEPSALDAARFQNLVEEGRKRAAEGDHQRAAASLVEALSLWRGPAAPELADVASARPLVARLEETRLTALEERVDAELSCGAHRRLVAELEGLTATYPLRERLWAARLVALYRCGRQSDALRAYQELRGILADELGLDPSPDLVRLEAAILAQDPTLEWRDATTLTPPMVQPLSTLPASSPFVGRHPEMARLEAARSEAAGGQRRAVLVAGEPGIGKTRLAAELAARAVGQGGLVLYGRCDEDLAVPYQPFSEALRPYVADCPDAVLDEVVELYGADLDRLLPEIGLRRPRLPEPPSADPDTQRYRLFEAVTALVDAAALHGPMTLILDDLQWATAPTVLLLRHLLRAPARRGLLVVGLYRHTELSRGHPFLGLLGGLAAVAGVDRVELRGLELSEVDELIIRNFPAARDEAAALFARTQGNPLFLTQLLESPEEFGQLPQSIREVVAGRLSHLSPAANRALTVAAVVGSRFSLRVLELIPDAAEDPSQLLDALDDAVSAGVLVEDGLPGRYGFAHELIRQGLASEVSSTRRAMLHRRAGEAIEKVGDIEAQLPALAYHWLEAAPLGDAAERALHYAAAAATHALDALAYEEAAAYYERALEVLDLGAEPTVAARCELLMALGAALGRAGATTRAKEAFLLATAAARTGGNTEALTEAALGYGGGLDAHHASMVPDERLVGLLREALGALPDRPSLAGVRLRGRLAVELDWSAAEECKALVTRAVADARSLGDPAALASALGSQRYALWSPFNLDERMAVTDEILALAGDAGDTDRVLQAHRWRLMDRVELGDIDGADADIEAHADLANRIRQPLYQGYTFLFRICRLTMAGRYEQAEALMADLAGLGSQVDLTLVTALAGLQRANVLFERGDVAAGITLHTAALHLSPPDWPAVAAFRAFAALWSDDTETAHFELTRLTAHDCRLLVPDTSVHASFTYLSQVCRELGDVVAADALLLAFGSLAGRNVVAGPPLYHFDGPVSYHLGLLAATKGDTQLACRYFADSIAMAERVGALPFVAHSQLQHGRALLDADEISPAVALLRSAQATAHELGMALVEFDAAKLLHEAGRRAG